MIGIVERAFQLAPECRSMKDLREKLSREGYGNIEVHLQSGFSLGKQLRALMKREGPEPEPQPPHEI